MPRCESVSWEEVDLASFAGLPSDHKEMNFGRLGGDIVMIDYGS